jgi:hypothetical protein
MSNSGGDEFYVARQKKAKRVALIIFGLVLLAHALVMKNCSGWNEGNMAVQLCYIDIPIARGLANLLYEFALLSAFCILHGNATYRVPLGVLVDFEGVSRLSVKQAGGVLKSTAQIGGCPSPPTLTPRTQSRTFPP